MERIPTQPQAAIIEDISGAGKCSLTVALPILSVAGVSCSVLPTAVLSTHPAGFTGYTYRDLTEDLLPAAQHWKQEGLQFDALYSGFLGSMAQPDILSRIFDLYKTSAPFILVDPVMGDNGKLYNMYNFDMVTGLRSLCAKASLITPNITEAALLGGQPFQEGPYTWPYIEALVKSLVDLGVPQVVLTGVYFDEAHIGAVCYEAAQESFRVKLAPRTPGYYHGTGDVFSAALLAGILRKHPLENAVQMAVDFTGRCIRATALAGTPVRNGLCFETELVEFSRELDRG